MKRILAVAMLFCACVSFGWAQSAGINDLATELSSLRDNCANQADVAKSSFMTAEYKNSLDSQLATDTARMDARVYRVGHGGRETTQYLADRIQEEHAKVEQQHKKIVDKMDADTKSVIACVADAENQGKMKYSAFKASHKKKPQLSEAESLMTAWLTNLKEISTDHPQGSDETSAAWKTAKSHAEISDL